MEDNLSSLFKVLSHKSVSAERRTLLALTWVKFCEYCPAEKSSWSLFLSNLEEAEQLRCLRCSGTDLIKTSGSRYVYCKSCKTDSSVTAGTFWHGIKKLRPWLAAIFFFQEKAFISAAWFAEILNIKASTAQHIFRSVLAAEHSAIEENECLVSSWHFIKLFNKRSYASVSFQHASKEEEAMQNRMKEDFEKKETGNSDFAKQAEEPDSSSQLVQQPQPIQPTDEPSSSFFQKNPLNELSEEAQKVFSEVLNGSQTIDQLFENLGIELSLLNAAITDLEMEGLIEEQSGGRFRVIPAVERLQRNRNLGTGTYWHLSGESCAGANCALCADTKAVTETNTETNTETSTELDIEINTDSDSNDIRAQIADFCLFIREVYQGFSRRFSGLYLVLQKFRNDSNVQNERTSLFYRCLQMGRSGTLADCTSGYVTPLLTPFYLNERA